MKLNIAHLTVAIAILCAFGYADANCSHKNRAGVLYIIPRQQRANGYYYQIEGLAGVNGRSPKRYIAKFGVNNCHNAEIAAKAAAASWHELFYVPNSEYKNFRAAIQAAVGNMEVAAMEIEEYKVDKDSKKIN